MKMELKNLNILNAFTKKEINNKSLALLTLVLLPAIFVTKSLEATLIYLLLFVVYIILTTLVTALIKLVAPKEIEWLITTISFVGVAILVAVLAEAFFINFFADFSLYVYLFSISALPFMIKEDNEEKGLNYAMLDALQSILVFALIVIIIALFREFLGTGGLAFGNYTALSFNFNVFGKYAISTLINPFGGLIVLGLLLTIINGKGVSK